MRNARLLLLVLVPVSACVFAAYAGVQAGGQGELTVSRFVSTSAPVSASTSPISVCRSSPDSVRSDLFGTPLPAVAKLVVSRKEAAPRSLAVVADPSPDLLSGYSITALGELNGERYVLFEDRKTREGRWLKVGEEIDGARIASIDGLGVTLSGVNGNQRLALNDKYDLTPLDKDAAYLGGRVTKHEGLEQEATVDKLAVKLLANVTTGNLYRAAEDYDKLNDSAFEGKVPLKEYHDRVNAAPVTTYNDLYVSYKLTIDTANVESLIVTDKK